MKKLLFTLFASLALVACSEQTTSENASENSTTPTENATPSAKVMLTGAWKLSDIGMAIPADAPADKVEEFNKMMEEMKASSSFSLAEDGKYKMSQSMGGEAMESTGTWTVSEDGKTFTTTEDESGKTDNFQIEQLDAHTFKFSMEDRGEKMSQTWTK